MTELPAYFSTGSGSPVVLLHCTMSSKSQWKTLSALLESEHQVLAPDLYGYGDTPMPSKRDGFTLLDEVALVQALVDRLVPPDQTVHLVGHSYGGAVALRYCHRFPERVRGLTVFEPVAFHLLAPDDPELASVLAMRAELGRLFDAGRPRDAAATFLDFWGGAETFEHYPPRVQEDFTRRTGKLILDFQAITGTRLSLEDYRELSLPVTVIAGRQSRGPALKVARELAGVLPDCSMKWVETGHMGPVTHPGLVNPVIAASITG